MTQTPLFDAAIGHLYGLQFQGLGRRNFLSLEEVRAKVEASLPVLSPEQFEAAFRSVSTQSDADCSGSSSP